MASSQIPMSGLKNQVLVSNGTVGEPSISFSGDSNTGLYRPSGDVLGVVTGGIERMRVDAAGNVGIGTGTPQALLDVGGSLKALEFNGNMNFSAYYKYVVGAASTTYANNLSSGSVLSFNGMIKEGTAVTKQANDYIFNILKPGTYMIFMQVSFNSQGSFDTHASVNCVVQSGTLTSFVSYAYVFCPAYRIPIRNQLVFVVVAQTAGSLFFNVTPNSTLSNQVREETFASYPFHTIQFMYMGTL